MDFKKLFSRKHKKTVRPKRPEYEDKNVQPRLPKTRERALSLYEPSQQTAGLLVKLPVELRHRIYDEVLGHRKVHVQFEFAPHQYRTTKRSKNELLEWRWWHCICTWDQTEDDRHRSIWWDQCRYGKVKGASRSPNGMMGKLKLDFAILLTCRQVYAEAIDILYSTTTFDLDTRQLLCAFPSLVLPQQFALISAIEMSWEFIDLGLSPTTIEQRPTVPGHVGHACRYAQPAAPLDRGRVARVPALGTARPGGSVLGPPKQLGKMDVFEVLVPRSYAENFSVDEGSNFTLGVFPDIITEQYCFGTSSAYI